SCGRNFPPGTRSSSESPSRCSSTTAPARSPRQAHSPTQFCTPTSGYGDRHVISAAPVTSRSMSRASPLAPEATLSAGLAALQARRPWRFAGLAALTSAASPIAFLLLVLIVVGLALGRRPQRWLQLAAGAGLLVVIGLEALLLRVFPASGRYPFSVAELGAA